MDNFLLAANVPRDTVRVTNLVWEFTEYTKPTTEEIARDHADLVDEILSCNPYIIGLVGGWAVEHVLLRPPEMEKCHGIPIWVPALFGDELPRKGGWIVIPLLHPAGAVHAPDSTPRILDDYLQLGRLLDGEITVRESDPYLNCEDYREFYGDEKVITDIAACDTEGSRRNPWCATISTKPGTGILFKPGQGITFQNKVYLHNSLHDLSVLRSMGIELAEDQFVDTMILAYNLCIEPQGLKALAYRHCAAHQDDYQDIIHDASRDRAIDYLTSVLGKPWPDVEPFIVIEGGKPRLKKPWNIERRVTKIITDYIDDKRDKDGNQTDPRKRWREIDDYVRDPVEREMGPMPEATLDDIDPEVAKKYAIRDADITLRLGPILEQKIRDMDLQKISAIDHAILPMLDRMQANGIKLAPTSFWDEIERECEDQMGRAKWAIYEATGIDLNPASGEQVADLLYNRLGLTPPKLTDSGSRGSVDGLCLESLLGENPIVQHVMDYTEANKLRGTYVYPLRKLCMVGDGRTRSTIRSTRTTTGRLSMADPPLHQIPILSAIGKKLRAGFIAEEGNVLGDWDVDQLEARVCAHDSRDPELCRLFNDGRDVHAETACRMFSVSMSQLSMNPDNGKVNDYRRSVAKHCIAEGQLVLTDQGLIPIEEINLQHKLWDGVEWVTHDGIIDQGIREVIEYDGLTATSDHEVFIATTEGIITKRAFGEVASSMGRIVTTGNGRQEIRACCGDIQPGEENGKEGVDIPSMPMYRLRQGFLEDEIQSAAEGLQGMQVMQPYQVRQTVSQQAGGAVRCHLSAMYQSEVSRVQGLWRTRYQVPVQITRRIRVLGGEEFASQGLCRSHDRSDRQQRKLRTRQSAFGQSSAAEPQSAQYPTSLIQRNDDKCARFRQSLRSTSDMEVHTERMDRRKDNTTCHRGSGAKSPSARLATEIKVARLSRVYDILNAGPRKRFTVSNKLISNCFFGIINGITEKGLVNYMIINRCRRPDGSAWTEDDCIQLLNDWFNIYKGVKKFHNRCMEETRQTGLARESIGGRLIYLPQIWSPIKMVRQTAERMSYVMYTQGGGQSIIKKAMAVVWKEVCKAARLKAEVLLQMHDELLFELPDNEDIKREVDRLVVGALTTTTKLIVPMKASGGFGQNWLEAH